MSAEAAKTLICKWEVPVSNLTRNTDYKVYEVCLNNLFRALVHYL